MAQIVPIPVGQFRPTLRRCRTGASHEVIAIALRRGDLAGRSRLSLAVETRHPAMERLHRCKVAVTGFIRFLEAYRAVENARRSEIINSNYGVDVAREIRSRPSVRQLGLCSNLQRITVV
jgi:hypothetical protein